MKSPEESACLSVTGFVPPAVPPGEAARLTTLRDLNILDTPADENFDRLTRLARRLFDVPIALVSLVDESRQWFKSSDGLDALETPRDISFCGHAILGPNVFVIPDATKDLRFAGNPLVLGEPKIRSYAGCPLRAENGHTLGTLCLIDRNPREFDAEDVSSLQDLAAMAEREIAAIRLATLDPLTGISNRRGFALHAGNVLKLSVRENTPTVLVYIDLDNFKPINDKFGHAEGDAVLVTFAELMRQEFRETDLFARIGGDEFAALFAATSFATAREVVARLDSAVVRYNENHGRDYAIGFSCGYIGFDPNVHDSVDGLLADGDRHMYMRKRAKSGKTPQDSSVG